MNIPVVQFTQSKKMVEMILLDIVRCPDGVYGVCVLKDGKTIQERTLRVAPIQSLIIPEEFYPSLLEYKFDQSNIINKMDEMVKSIKDINSNLNNINKQLTSKTPKTTKKTLVEDKK